MRYKEHEIDSTGGVGLNNLILMKILMWYVPGNFVMLDHLNWSALLKLQLYCFYYWFFDKFFFLSSLF